MVGVNSLSRRIPITTWTHCTPYCRRPLWKRTQNGYYIFNPDLKLRAHSGAEWVPWKQWLNQPLVNAGCDFETLGKEWF